MPKFHLSTILLIVCLSSIVAAQSFESLRRRNANPFRSNFRRNVRRFNGDGDDASFSGGSSSGLIQEQEPQLKEDQDLALDGGSDQQSLDGTDAGGSSLDGGDSTAGDEAPVDESLGSDSADGGSDGLDNGPADNGLTADSNGDLGGSDVENGDSVSADLSQDEPAAGGVAPSEGEKDPNDLTWLRNAIRGEPGKDYPIFSEVPDTGFKCSDRERPGYYGDSEARCQVFHICQLDGRSDSFLCPNGTIFSQRNFVCVWWWQYDCSQTEKDWALNSNIWQGWGDEAAGDGQSRQQGEAGGSSVSDDSGSSDSALADDGQADGAVDDSGFGGNGKYNTGSNNGATNVEAVGDGGYGDGEGTNGGDGRATNGIADGDSSSTKGGSDLTRTLQPTGDEPAADDASAAAVDGDDTPIDDVPAPDSALDGGSDEPADDTPGDSAIVDDGASVSDEDNGSLTADGGTSDGYTKTSSASVAKAAGRFNGGLRFGTRRGARRLSLRRSRSRSASRLRSSRRRTSSRLRPRSRSVGRRGRRLSRRGSRSRNSSRRRSSLRRKPSLRGRRRSGLRRSNRSRSLSRRRRNRPSSARRSRRQN